MNKLNNLKNKKICILGFGIENQNLLRFLLKKKINSDIVICDSGKLDKYKKNFKNENINWVTGKNYDKDLDKFDIVFRVAGYPLFTREIKKAIRSGVEISSPIKLFFDLCPTRNIIGVTGTKGKGTTSSLIAGIIKASGKKVYLGGNIGTPVFSFFTKIKKQDFVVLELSSFQLEDLHKSPHISVITNFSREHLAPADPKNPNYHKSLNVYWQAKSNIFSYQKEDDYLIIDNKISKKVGKAKSKVVFFKKSELNSRLVGEYNKKNIGTAVEVAKILKIKKNVVEKAVKNFKGLPHRIEFVRMVSGVRYFDNSFATTPEATIEDLKSFVEPVILLLGGADKGSDFKNLSKEVVKKKVKFVVLLDGVATKKIKKNLLAAGYLNKNMKLAGSMVEAVEIARDRSDAGDAILLSTACASFGMFNNYKERGDLFKKFVEKL